MSKIELQLNFNAIRERIEHQKKRYKPGVWADMVGVARNIVSNVHGKVKQKPSLEYIVAVSKATGKSVDYYLWGKELEETQLITHPNNIRKIIIEHQDIVKRFKDPEKAKEFNEILVEIEDDDPAGYDGLFKEAKIIHKTIKRLKRKSPIKKKQEQPVTRKRANEK